jgi:hypothetical protein
MQLSAKADQWREASPGLDQPAGAAGTLKEYETRRCHLCGCRHPSFGFGPPLVPAGRTLWACLAHRHEVDLMLTRENSSTAEDRQLRLL